MKETLTPFSYESAKWNIENNIEMKAMDLIAKANPGLQFIKTGHQKVYADRIDDFGADIEVWMNNKLVGYIEIEHRKALNKTGYSYSNYKLFKRRLKHYNKKALLFIFNSLDNSYMMRSVDGLKEIIITGNLAEYKDERKVDSPFQKEGYYYLIPKTKFIINQRIEEISTFFKG